MKRLLISVAVLALLVAPRLTFGADVDDLKAAVERAIKAFNSLDPAPLASTVHPGFVMFDRDSAFADVSPMQNVEASTRTGLQSWFATLESLNITPVNYQYKVVGNTGIVWGYETMTYKPKGGPMQTIQSRVTSVYLKSGGKWLIIMSHSSAIPSGD
jgi:ketosteroid isomerase-like protein